MLISTASPMKYQSKKVLAKGMIAKGLVLIMVIPNIIVQKIVFEREACQKQQKISTRWATSQTLAGPFSATLY